MLTPEYGHVRGGSPKSVIIRKYEFGVLALCGFRPPEDGRHTVSSCGLLRKKWQYYLIVLRIEKSRIADAR
ncbi:hypothetical protein QUF80_08520 [Desulfococcaceae bacterium HSG8]|nr:hypothetical protein [Desulfococcaceae bacterium HSG8]